MGRFVSATGQFLLATYGHSSCPPTGSFSCPLTDKHVGTEIIALLNEALKNIGAADNKLLGAHTKAAIHSPDDPGTS